MDPAMTRAEKDRAARIMAEYGCTVADIQATTGLDLATVYRITLGTPQAARQARRSAANWLAWQRRKRREAVPGGQHVGG